MHDRENAVMDELCYYFAVKQVLHDGNHQLSLSSYAPFRDDQTTLPFDTEMDAALYLLDEFHKGAVVSMNDVEIAKAIIHGEGPMFVYEEKLSDGILLLSLHDCLPPERSNIVTFGSRSRKLLARFILKRLHESKRVRASEETLRQAQMLME